MAYNSIYTSDATITKISTGASTIPGNSSNKNPVPKRYKWPLSSTISPIYITIVTADATIDGSNTASVFFFPTKNEPAYTPTLNQTRQKQTHKYCRNSRHRNFSVPEKCGKARKNAKPKKQNSQ